MSTSRVIGALFLLPLAVLAGCSRRNAHFEIPSDYVGWVNVKYLAASCPEGTRGTPTVSVISIDANGKGCSRTWDADGLMSTRFFYVDANGRRVRELRATHWGKGGEIWGPAVSLKRSVFRFFVGDEAAFKKRPPPRPRQSSAPPDPTPPTSPP